MNSNTNIPNIEVSIRKNRFEWKVMDAIAYSEYIIADNKLVITNSYIHKSLHSIKDIGVTLAKSLKDISQLMNLSLDSKCPYMNGLLKNLD
jgi:hypothetical protein